jgi:uncharacterized membrane protein
VLLRDIAVAALCALVIRQIYRPELDLVRYGGRVDDPSGGVFDGAPDAPPRWLPDWLRPHEGRISAAEPEGAERTVVDAKPAAIRQ